LELGEGQAWESDRTGNSWVGSCVGTGFREENVGGEREIEMGSDQYAGCATVYDDVVVCEVLS
jgi:hypothetical protein